MPFICEPGQTRPDVLPTALHTLNATPATVHWGYFDPSIKPALRIKSGDLVSAEAITHHAGDAPDLMMDEAVTRIFTEIPEDDRNPGVHIMGKATPPERVGSGVSKLNQGAVTILLSWVISGAPAGVTMRTR